MHRLLGAFSVGASDVAQRHEEQGIREGGKRLSGECVRQTTASTLRALQGGALLVPAATRVRSLAVAFSSPALPHRAPLGCHVATALLGGARDPAAAHARRGELQVRRLQP
jgi:hypothetical protein